jgi:LacI family transcriptional regulator
MVSRMSGRPTIRDVADRAGVSIATVSRVLNERADVSAKTRERVWDVARTVVLPNEYVREGDFSSASGYRETCALLALAEPPTAIVAASDLMALAGLQAIRDVGLEPGRDVAIVGFDDLEAAALAHPPLTTIRQDRQELGTIAAERAIELIEGPEAAPPETVVPVELVVRASSAP